MSHPMPTAARPAHGVPPHDHPDSLGHLDVTDQLRLKVAARAAASRWRRGWRVRPCPVPRCPVWQWHRPAEDDDGDPTGGR